MDPNLLGTRDQFCGRQFFHRRGGVGRMAQAVMRVMGSNGEWQMKLHSLAPPLTSCRAARLLTGHGPVTVRGPGVGDP